MVQFSATRCSCVSILWVSLVSFAAIILCVASQRMFSVVVLFRYRLGPETFEYTLVQTRQYRKMLFTIPFFNGAPRHEGVLGSGGIAPRILNLSARWRCLVSFTPGGFTPRERTPGTHWIGGWVGPRVGLDAGVLQFQTHRHLLLTAVAPVTA
jgi:hypothetical protein